MVFDAPTRDWAGRRTTQTVDVYLYDIREDMRRRERGVLKEYNADTTISGVAEAAGVSVQTVCKAFGSKAALAKRVYDVTLVGARRAGSAR